MGSDFKFIHITIELVKVTAVYVHLQFIRKLKAAFFLDLFTQHTFVIQRRDANFLYLVNINRPVQFTFREIARTEKHKLQKTLWLLILRRSTKLGLTVNHLNQLFQVTQYKIGFGIRKFSLIRKLYINPEKALISLS